MKMRNEERNYYIEKKNVKSIMKKEGKEAMKQEEEEFFLKFSSMLKIGSFK